MALVVPKTLMVKLQNSSNHEKFEMGRVRKRTDIRSGAEKEMRWRLGGKRGGEGGGGGGGGEGQAKGFREKIKK